MKESKSRIQCLDRAMDILEALSRSDGIGVSELAAELGLHVATTHNLLTVLLARNYVLNDKGSYRLGPALAALTNRSDPLLHLAQIAQPYLEKITRETGESAITSILSGERVIMIATTASADGLTCPAVNQVFPSPLNLATGRVLVAYQPAKKWSRYIQTYQQQERATGKTSWLKAKDWESIFSAIHETDPYFIAYGKDSGAVAVPIHDARGVVVAALGSNSLSHLSDRHYREKWIAMVHEAGCLISRELGYTMEQRKCG